MKSISSKEYDQLTDDSLFLNALRAGGVDNWTWYGDAVEKYHECKEEGVTNKSECLGDKEVSTITISVELYEELIADQSFLEALRGCGVDNWEGYGEAQNMVSND